MDAETLQSLQDSLQGLYKWRPQIRIEVYSSIQSNEPYLLDLQETLEKVSQIRKRDALFEGAHWLQPSLDTDDQEVCNAIHTQVVKSCKEAGFSVILGQKRKVPILGVATSRYICHRGKLPPKVCTIQSPPTRLFVTNVQLSL